MTMKKANKIRLNNVLYEIEDLAARNQIKELENNINGGENLGELEARVSSVESNLSKANTDIDNIESNLSKASTDIDNIKKDLTQANTDIDGIESNLSKVSTDIGNIESNLSKASIDIDNIGSNLSKANTDIEGIKKDLSDPKRKYYETVTLNDEGTFYNEETGSWDVCTLEPNKFYIWQKPIDDTLCINFAEEIPGVTNEYLLQFSTGSFNEVELVTPENDWDAYNKLKFQDGTLGCLICDSYTTYQVSIINGLATAISFSNKCSLYFEISEGDNYIGGLEGKYIDSMTWGEWIENEEFSELTAPEDNYTFDSLGAFAVNDSGIIISYLVGENAVELLDSSDNPVLATSKISNSPYYKLIGPAEEEA